MEYAIYQASSCEVIELHSHFNADTVNEIRGCFDGFLRKNSGDVLIDMSAVTDLDSSGIGAMVFLFKRLKTDHRNLGLLGVNGKPEELLKMLHIHQAIKKYSSVDDFLQGQCSMAMFPSIVGSTKVL